MERRAGKRNSKGTSAATLLFERLPDKLFSPLASPSRHRYWSLLCALHSKRFGPDAPLPPTHGHPIKVIAQDIEDELMMEESWAAEAVDAPLGATFSMQASLLLDQLRGWGWFQDERHGIERNLVMRPAVSQLLTTLVSFAETGPVFVSGKIRSIDLNIQQVLEGNAEGDTLSEAADQSRNLIEYIRNTGTNIRDLMESMGTDMTTSEYVRAFFNEYIERVFIGDYRELRTRDHPLSKRQQILEAVEKLSNSEIHRKRLIDWYESKRCSGDRNKAEKLFERDIYRLNELKRIDEYLDRLDDEVRRANRRTLALLDYRLRSLRPVDKMVKKAISLVSEGGHGIASPFPVGAMISQERLAEPRKVVDRLPASPLRRTVPSDEDMAKSRLMIRARDARSMTAPRLAEWLFQTMGERSEMDSSALPSTSIRDVRAYQVLSCVALATKTNDPLLKISARALARGVTVRLNDELEPEGAPISGRSFQVERNRKRTPNKGKDA